MSDSGNWAISLHLVILRYGREAEVAVGILGCGDAIKGESEPHRSKKQINVHSCKEKKN